MPVDDLIERLESLDDTWAGAEVNEGGNYDNLPDGTYQVRIEEVCFRNARSSGALMFEFTFAVAAGEHQGRKVWHRRMLNTDDGVKYLKQDLHRLGMRAARLSEVQGRLAELLDLMAEIRLKTTTKDGRDYQNVYVNKLIEFELAPSAADDDIPF